MHPLEEPRGESGHTVTEEMQKWGVMPKEQTTLGSFVSATRSSHPTPPHGRHRPSQGTQTTWGNSRKEQMANCEHGHTHDIGGQWSDRAWAPRAGLRDFKQRTRPPMVNGVSAQELREDTRAAYSVILAKL